MPEADARLAFNVDDFVLKFDEIGSSGPGGELRPQFVGRNPVLATLPGDGIGQNLVILEACGVNQPHHHPRGTEFSHQLTGQLEFAFLEENGSSQRLINTKLDVGETIVIPQGALSLSAHRFHDLGAFVTSSCHANMNIRSCRLGLSALVLQRLAAIVSMGFVTSKRC